MMNKEKLIKWCWENLEFYNNPESWEDTYIIDILNGYRGDCHDVNGKAPTYSKIRMMFEETEEEEILVKTSGLKLYEIKLKHNDGIITIITSGTSEEEVKKSILKSERAPESAIKSIKIIKEF